ncbi:hypothetical protein T4D_5262 [Trichinella pseudospiralis]|uniref:Uncharacterized protein n=1 Tax=Trichinella pseudospiralis TaxID=6337 RepID=A0A0V1FX18_TRIPS|nr:hypothetical protein T4D_5262 [Trichinella pseudospiralis]
MEDRQTQYIPVGQRSKVDNFVFPTFHQDGIRRSPARQLEVDNASEQVNCVHQKRSIEKPNAAPSPRVIVGQ